MQLVAALSQRSTGQPCRHKHPADPDPRATTAATILAFHLSTFPQLRPARDDRDARPRALQTIHRGESVCIADELKLTSRMRELLEKAHQEDEDELFREVEDDEEFAAPRMYQQVTEIQIALTTAEETRDVFLEDFADTDEEVEMDEEEQERLMRREERRKVGVSTKESTWS